ncbi:MAG: GTP 3',8-cyclase MoaA [Propionibacteriaceae bacterium]|jgi:cyclic pyranopterin phosphate synthase|nr:GTP 3',8-cyclase MoaA [Propionibacteriaceae bacterium]
MTGLVDQFGRQHRDLRVSITDRCSLRCWYCLPVAPKAWLPKASLLTPIEIQRLVGIARTLGIERVRLTGGEALVRPDLVEIVRRIAALPDPPELALTTNGIGLAKLAQPLAEAGLRRVNVSLDSLDRATYALITGRDCLPQALGGLEAAVLAGLHPVKINAVLMPEVNDHEGLALLDFAIKQGYELRFIEQMPLDSAGAWHRSRMVSADDIHQSLTRHHHLTRLPDQGHAPATRWLVDGGPAVVGFIAAITEPFCKACDRLRLTADGALRSCLFAHQEVDLRTPLRQGASDDDIASMIVEAVANKPRGHQIGNDDFVQPVRVMSAIGG